MQTLCDILEKLERDDRAELLHVRDGETFRVVSAAEFVADVERCAALLHGLGLRPGERVGIISANRPEWHVVDFAAYRLGAIVVPLFPTLTASEVAYSFADSGCSVAMVDTEEQMQKVLVSAPALPELRSVLVLDPLPEMPTVDDGPRPLDFRRAMADAPPSVEAPGPESADTVATIIYTSGTTGEPKGVMLTHGNFLANVQGIAERIPARPEDIGMSLLPLCHSFQRTVDYSYFYGGAAVAYSSPQAASADFRAVRPTIMIGVPRLFQKMRAAIEERVEESSPVARRLFRAALHAGRTRAEARLEGKAESVWNRIAFALLDRLVLHRIREATGGRLRLMSSGGAALDPDLNWWFLAVGWNLVQGYGLTESSPIIAANGVEENRVGSVGPPLSNVEVRIADDGEVLTRGPHVMKGYWQRPEETERAMDNGWLRTGDVGRLEDGYLYITDRKKSLLVTSTGKKVAPQPLENRLLRSGWVEQIMVVGDDRRFIAAIIVPERTRVERWAERERIDDGWDQVVAREDLRATIQADLDRLQADFAPYEQVRDLRLVTRPFTVESGQLTPTLKVVRRVVERDHADLIEEIYAD